MYLLDKRTGDDPTEKHFKCVLIERIKVELSHAFTVYNEFKSLTKE